MRQVKDVMLLALTAGKQGKFDEAAKLFSSCLSMEGIDGYMEELSRPGLNAQTGNTNTSDNTLAPSLATAASVIPMNDLIASMATDMESVAAARDEHVDLSEMETYIVMSSEEELEIDDDEDLSDDEIVDTSEVLDESDDDLDESAEVVVVASVGPVGTRN